jgi:hypothetical protein
MSRINVLDYLDDSPSYRYSHYIDSMVENHPALLTRTEIEWLLGNAQVSKGYEYRIKSDIKRKLKTFQQLELPLPQKHAYTLDLSLTANPQNLSANPQTSDALVAKTVQSEGGVKKHEVKGQKALDGIRTHDLRFTKPSLSQAELLGHAK